MVAMESKFGRTYCAISDSRIFFYFQLQLPQNVTDGNETYEIYDIGGLQNCVSEC